MSQFSSTAIYSQLHEGCLGIVPSPLLNSRHLNSCKWPCKSMSVFVSISGCLSLHPCTQTSHVCQPSSCVSVGQIILHRVTDYRITQQIFRNDVRIFMDQKVEGWPLMLRQ
uniref:Tnks protein n=1 Tax=Mus musculus TaxID=10090 RepID=Q8BND2_MOUSE|nr:Tnks protein [Mus musculus]BAC39085.1 unnamed protein product [Mus musculus]